VLSSLADDPEPAGVAGALLNTIPVVHGAGLTAPVARRWKTQLNENSKVAAFASELPEANHNEIEGWEHGRELGSLSAVFLEDPGAPERIKRRTEIYADILGGLGAPVARVQARGDTPVARVLSLVMMGDLVSVRLAELAGTEATPVAAIEGFKAQL
jgi:glucose/mannose-6-phosphate isomerase